MYTYVDDSFREERYSRIFVRKLRGKSQKRFVQSRSVERSSREFFRVYETSLSLKLIFHRHRRIYFFRLLRPGFIRRNSCIFKASRVCIAFSRRLFDN